MDPSRETRSANWFVLSVEDDGEGDSDLHGTIESTRGNLHVRFASGRELLDILCGVGAGDDEPATAGEGSEHRDA